MEMFGGEECHKLIYTTILLVDTIQSGLKVLVWDYIIADIIIECHLIDIPGRVHFFVGH